MDNLKVGNVRAALAALGIGGKRETAVTTRSPRPLAPVPAVPIEIEPRPAADIPPRELSWIQKMARRQIVHLTGEHLDSVWIREVYGRVALVEFYPIKHTASLQVLDVLDPIMPVPLVDLQHQPAHNKAYTEMVRLMTIMEDPQQITLREAWQNWRTGWPKLAQAKANTIIQASEGFLRPDEWAYYADHLHECVANPARNISIAGLPSVKSEKFLTHLLETGVALPPAAVPTVIQIQNQSRRR